MKKKKILTAALGASAIAGVGLYKKVDHFVDDCLYRTHIQRTVFQNIKPKQVRIKNMNEAILTGYLLEADGAVRTLIMLHAFQEDASSLENEANYFQKLLPQTNILMVDSYAHGSSDGVTRGIGYQDVMDVNYWNRFIIQKYGSTHQVLFYGKETGAVALLCAGSAGLLKNTKALICESSFRNVLDYFSYQLKEQTDFLETLTKPLLSIILRRELNTNLENLDTLRYIEKNKIPTFFIQNKNDRKVDFNEIFDLYNASTCDKELLPLKDEPFYALDTKNPYKDLLKEFLDRNGIKEE